MTISGPSLKHRAKQLRYGDRFKLVQWAWSWYGWNKGEGAVKYNKVCNISKGRITWCELRKGI